MNEIPDVLYFYDFLIREEELTPWHAGLVVKTFLAAREHFGGDPSEQDITTIEEYITSLPNWKKGIFITAITSWRKFTALGEKARRSDARVSLQLVGYLLGGVNRLRVLRWYKWYCLDRKIPMQVLATPYGGKIYLVPVDFYNYAKRMKEEDDARWLPNPFKEGG
ncbi:MAG: hypothetical protein H0Z19_10370 [Archaeoglobus sp.]|uniref:hypothetical protein n=1 Tax=Archaeoglobus sp. TaxID=1872626 RepID=UPI001D458479|nr:hypothetical protein [Archaeoglobus sp.]MBO8180858.1 hypothetical protein [Archaeoglobus sp.]